MFFKNDPNDRSVAPRRTVPALPLRDIIVFPHMVSQLFVGREKSIAALDEAMAHDKEIFLAAQKNAKTNEPTPEDIFTVGTLGTVMQLLRLPDGTVKVLVEGKRRARIKRFAQTDEFFLVEVDEIAEVWSRGVEVEALMRSVWGLQTFGRTRTLDSHASRLRRKLCGDGHDKLVVNVWGVGYRLIDGVLHQAEELSRVG